MIKKFLPILFILLAALLLLAAVLPGAGAVKAVGDRFVADGDFQDMTPALYGRLRPAFLASAALLLAAGLLFRRAARTGSRAAAAWGFVLAGGYLLGSVGAAASLLTARSESPVFRLAAGTPVFYATPAPLEPGRLERIAAMDGRPTALANAGDDSGRIFVALQDGRILAFRDDALLPQPFLDLTGRVISENVYLEQGLLGLAFHPGYAQNGEFYVDYIDPDGNTVISRFSVSGADPDRADPDSEQRLLSIVQPSVEHNGGGLAFGPDGYLYIGSGDGGPQGDPNGNGQSLDSLLGKLLRIDVDGGDPYAIPPDNPFAGRDGLDEIFGFGMRNPWRFAFDLQTGDLFIADVGNQNFEEIDFIPAGSPGGFNLGWKNYEGFAFYNGYEPKPVPELPDHTPPVLVYEHGDGGRCAIVGGLVYRGAAVPALHGWYIYGDFCSGEIWGLQRTAEGVWAGRLLFDTDLRITSFGAGEDGELYVLSYIGEIYRLYP